MAESKSTAPTNEDYRRLAAFRYALRRFLHFSEDAARTAGISPNQYQLLLFVRGFNGTPPTIGELAEQLQIEHQSAVGLVDRSESGGLVARKRDPKDRRRVRISLTPKGAAVLRRLVRVHSPELDKLSSALFRIPAA